LWRINARGYRYYRCAGSQPLRKGCGAPMIPAVDLENMVNVRMFLNEA
jgi:hypothetical protein